jgi:hypothetical protein
MVKLVRKNVFLDPETLRRAQEILGTRSESEAIREALALVALRHEVMQRFDAVAALTGVIYGRRSDTLPADTSAYLMVLRNALFAATFRPRVSVRFPVPISVL